jgi:hypothetical protein
MKNNLDFDKRLVVRLRELNGGFTQEEDKNGRLG